MAYRLVLRGLLAVALLPYFFSMPSVMAQTQAQPQQVIPPEFDKPFDGTLKVTVMEAAEMRAYCAPASDLFHLNAAPGACSHRKPDPFHPGKWICSIHYQRLSKDWWPEDQVWAIRVETAKCNGWDDGWEEEKRKEERLLNGP